MWDKFLGRYMNRFPMLAEGGGSGGGAGYADDSEDDDPTKGDDDDEGDEGVEDLGALIREEEEEDDESSDDDAEGDGEAPKTPPQEAPKTITMTQEEFDAALDRRMARERAQADKRLEEQRWELESQKQAEGFKQWTESEITRRTERLTNLGYDEDTAREIATEDVARDVKIARAEQESAQNRQRETIRQRQLTYAERRGEMLAREPFVAKYIKEIDEFSGKGVQVEFDVAMKYVLGDKFASGELQKTISKTAEQRTLKNVNKRGKTRVEGATGTGAPGKGETLTRDQRKVAAALGLTPKEYLSGLPKAKKR